jgi:predicted dithiol-disulfide oxidoreductase (DUF899 family)
LPIVPVEKTYTFHAADGSTPTLKDLFAGKSQLIVYHFMFDTDWDDGCRGCSFVAEHFPDTRHLGSKDTAFVAISRAPVAKIEAYKKKTGWEFPWYSSEGGGFNYDFHVTLDEKVEPVEYNFKSPAELEAKGLTRCMSGEQPGLSVFKLEDGIVYHTYSAYSRGLERLLGTFTLLDMTPAGRQVGPSGPGEFKRNYEYDEED